MMGRLSRSSAEAFDADDELAGLRSRFAIPEERTIYLDGNSLGRPPLEVRQRVLSLLDDEWAGRLVRGWNEGWYDAPRRVGELIGRIVGAAPDEILVSDSTTVDLFKAVTAALRMRPGRTAIVSDILNFPSDLYVIEGVAKLLGAGHRLELIGSRDGGVTPDLDALSEAIDRRPALVVLSHVTYKSGYLYDLAAVTRAAHERGALTVWDLSHSVGVVPIDLDAAQADFAVGCTYKYLNGGPGSPAFVFARREVAEKSESPIWGWFGRESPFSFELEYRAAPGVARFLAGTPPILSLIALEAALAPTLGSGPELLRRKSTALTEYLIALFDARLASLGFTLHTPREAEQRGSHVAIGHPAGYQISQALIGEMGVIPDFREPDLIRLGCAPLYTSFTEIWDAVDRMKKVVEERRFERYSSTRHAVT